GVAHPSASQGPLSAGSYSFIAHYNGDPNYTATDSPCEPLEVTALTPTAPTEIHNASHAVVTSVPAGATVHDKATVSGSFGTATDSPCEPLEVTALTPTALTEIHNASHNVVVAVPAGTTVHDKATVSGSFGTPTGTVTFTFFTTSSTCTGTSVASGTVTLDASGVAHPSASQGPLSASSYSFIAHYNGDPNYTATDSPCEPLEVTALTPTALTEIHNASHNVVVAVPAGTTVHDKATLAGAFGTPTG